jgi:hypothetical protein
MTEGTDTPTEGQGAITAPADSETSKPAAVETTTPDNETEHAAETEAKTEGDESAEVKADEPDKPKKRNGYDRLRRKNQYLQSEILRLREEASKPAADDSKAPREEDFNGDWGKYIAATAAYEAAKAVKDTLTAQQQEQNKSKVAELQSEVHEEFEERSEAFKAKAPDFDEVIGKFVDSGGKLSDVVRDLILDSDVGPEAAYFLAKNPRLAKDLNSLAPLQAAKEFGKIEATLSRPPTKAKTSAPPPIKPPSGGASPPVDEAALAKSDDATALIQHWRAKAKARA